LTYFLTPVFALGVGLAIGLVYYEGDDRARKDATVWTATALLAVSALILIGLGVFLQAPLSNFLFPDRVGNYSYEYLVVVVLATAALGIVAQPLMVYLQLENRAGTFVALTVASTLVTIGLSVFMVVGLRRGIQGMLEAALIAQAITLALALLPPLRRVRLALDRRIALSLLRLGIPLIPSFLAAFVMLQVNKYLIQMDLGLGAVGVYTIGFNLGLFMTLFVGGFTNAWYPFFMSYIDRQEEAKPLFGRVFSYYFLGLGALSLLFYMAARPGVLLLTHGVAFRGAYVVVGPSATAQLFIGATSILLAGMYFAKKVQYQAIVQGVAAVGAMALNLVLIPPLGISGAAIALASGFAVVAVGQHVWNVRAHYLAVEYEWSRVGRFTMVYVVYAVLFSSNREFPLPIEILASAVGTIVLAAVLYSLLYPSERVFMWSLADRVRRRTLALRPFRP
jgi:O-antigen/teichoic acid export membrane protein